MGSRWINWRGSKTWNWCKVQLHDTTGCALGTAGALPLRPASGDAELQSAALGSDVVISGQAQVPAIESIIIEHEEAGYYSLTVDGMARREEEARERK